MLRTNRVGGSRLRRKGTKSEAVCVRHFTPSAKGYAGSVLEFSTAAGERVIFEATSHRFAPAEIGGSTTVVYDPANPGRRLLEKDLHSRTELVLFLMASIICGGILLLMIITG